LTDNWRKSTHSGGSGGACVEVGSTPWRKSTYSGGSGGNCVEIGSTPWRKSTYSGASGGECVEAGAARGMVLVRDTKDNGEGPVLRVSAQTWRTFTTAIRATPRG
jgi:Domain of unknown function (DUF397)